MRHRAGHRLLPLSDVLRFSAADAVVCAHTTAGSPIADYTLAELEARFAGAFVRASRSELVNVSHVDRIAGNGDGSATLTLSDRTEVHVSRRRAAEVKGVLGR